MNQLTPNVILFVIIAYFLILLGVSYFTSKNSTNTTFFTANKSSPWWLVAIGMIGASLSGVTFISIPGVVGKETGANINFAYMQMVFGYLAGYFLIATVLMPIYYKYNLTSIYGYLENRLGFYSYKTGAAFFLLSRIIGASFRLYLVAMVFDQFILAAMGVPFWLTVVITILLIWLYTFKSGIKTIVFTDTIQTFAMILAVVFTLIAIIKAMNFNITDMIEQINIKGYSKTFYFKNGWEDPNNFFKQFVSGAIIALVMTGLDQDMMQKNLTCKTLKDAQKNMLVFSTILVVVNLLFLILGAMLYVYAGEIQIKIPEKTDQLYPLLALNYLGVTAGLFFIIGLIAAAYSSADSALTSLTTSFCVDFLNLHKQEESKTNKQKRRQIHIAFSIILLIVIIIFNEINNSDVITQLFVFAGYTYGPILGLFAFGILTKKNIKDSLVVLVCVVAPIITYIVNINSANWFGGFQFGYLIYLLNGTLTFLGLMAISKKET